MKNTAKKFKNLVFDNWNEIAYSYETGGKKVPEAKSISNSDIKEFISEFGESDSFESLNTREKREAIKSFREAINEMREKSSKKMTKGAGIGVKPVTYYVAYTSYFDTNKYDVEKMTKALKKLGATNIHTENDGGKSNQPEVVVFDYKGDGTDYEPTKAVQKAFDTDWIIIRVKNWRTKKMATGGGVGESEKIYRMAETMTDSELQKKLSKLNKEQKKEYEILVRLGDSPKLAIATVLLQKQNKWDDDTIRAYTMAKGGGIDSENF